MQPLDITDRIREHAEQLDAETAPVLFTDLRGPKMASPTDADAYASHPLRGWMVATASALAVLLLIGGSIALLNVVAGDSEPEAATVPTTVPTPSTTAGLTSTSVAPQVPPPVRPVPPPETPPTSWTRIDTEMAAQSAAAGPLRILAIDRSRLPDVLLWVSIDEQPWESVEWEGGDAVETITYAGSRYIAFGGHWGIELWSSIDGITWVEAERIDDGDGPDERVGPGDPPPGTYSQISQIAYGNDRYVAVGDVRDHGEEGYSYPRAAVWTSPDAMTWTRLAENDEVFDGPWHQEMSDVAFGSNGFVAVGSTDGEDGGSSVPAIWHSPDGFVWTRIVHNPDLFGVQIPGEWWGLWSVAYGNDGYVAAGTGGRILVSQDGLTWTRASTDDLGDQIALVDLVYGDGSYVAVGNDWSASEEDGGLRVYVPAIWHSTDAISWVRVADDNDLFGGPFTGEDDAGSMTATFADGLFIVMGYDEVWGDSGPSVKSGHVWIGESTP